MTSNIEQNSSTHPWFDAHRGETFRLLAGNVENSNANLMAALDCFNKALEKDNSYIWATAHRGIAYRQIGNLELAEEAFKTVISKALDNPWGYAQLGETYYLQLKKSSRNSEDQLAKKAIDNFNKAISLYNEYAWAYAHLGVTYYWLAQYDSAKNYLNEAIRLTDNSYAWAFAYLGMVCHKLSDFENARKYWELAERLDGRVLPDNHNYDMALLSELAGKFDEAIEQYNKQLQEDPNNPLALYGIALATVRNQGLNEAQIEIDRATTVLKQYTDQASLYMLSALAYLQGSHDRAREYIQTASISSDDDQISIPFNGIRRSLAVNDLSWLGLDRDEGFQALIS
ncbi:MAG TPA: hypothetical protein V6D26_29580 [Stenomitos sp.]